MNKYNDYKELRDKGMTYQQIAEHFGVSKQAVHQSICNSRVYARCVYPALRDWMTERHMSIVELSNAIGMKYKATRAFLLGEVVPKKPIIDAMIGLTGMTYEEMFADE